MWRADNVIVGVNFVRGHRTLQDESLSICGVPLTLTSIPNDDPNVQPLVKGLDVDDFSVDKFLGLQDPTSPNLSESSVQASPDFEEDLRTNQRLRLQAEVRNLGAEPQRVTRSTHVHLDYEPTILPDVPPTDNPTRPVTLDLSVDARKDPSFPPPSQIVPVPALVDLTQNASSPENKDRKIKDGLVKTILRRNLPAWIFVPIHGKNHWSLAIIWLHNDVAWLAHLDSSQRTHDPEAIFHVLKQVLWLIVPIDPALVMTGIMNVKQQKDGHSYGKHVLQMLVGATMKESDRLDRCFREEGA
ncbi:hypothetical protein R1flu_020299 [Riccia fluitans]|uniref:Ubiquitin-like protease family profile domain-containing protein n=1 Tax=Riccia fluitans TaxID=41844 RepID=A0ABD1ZL40_9MARC